MSALLLWLFAGALVGWLASELTGTRRGLLASVLLGLVGATLGGVVMRAAGYSSVNINQAVTLYSVLVSVLGAVLLLALGGLVRRLFA